MAKKETEVPPVPDTETVVEAFQSYEEGTAQVYAHLAQTRFGYTANGDAVLAMTDQEGDDVLFMFPPSSDWPMKQFLKFLGVPFTFFKKCSNELQVAIVEEFRAKLEDTSEEAPEGDVLIKYRETSTGVRILRGLVPFTYHNVLNTSVMDCIEALRSDKWELIVADGIRQDNEKTFLRFLTGSQITIGEKVLDHGFDVSMSELGGCKLSIHPILFDRDSGASTVATRTMAPWFMREYDGDTIDEFQQALETLIETQDTKGHRVESVVRDGIDESWGDSEAKRKDMLLELDGLQDFAGVTKASIKALAAELNHIPTRWQLAMHLARIASTMKDFTKRQRHESAAGILLGLDINDIWDEGSE